MSKIDFVHVKIEPSYFTQSDSVTRSVTITVKVAGKKEYNSVAIMDDTDFQSHFDWLLDRIRLEVKDALKDIPEQGGNDNEAITKKKTRA
jgi:DNA-binding protein YbaB